MDVSLWTENQLPGLSLASCALLWALGQHPWAAVSGWGGLPALVRAEARPQGQSFRCKQLLLLVSEAWLKTPDSLPDPTRLEAKTSLCPAQD